MAITSIRVETVGPFRIELLRSALGQVTEYDVHRTDTRTNETNYVGGGTKREARRAFSDAIRAATKAS